MKKKTTRVDEILSYKAKEFVIEEQKAELLLRNQSFLLDLAKLDTYFSLWRKAQEKFATLLQAAFGEARKGAPVFINEPDFPIKAKRMALAEFGLLKWPEAKWFFNKWEISKSWNGDRATLYQFIEAGARLWLFTGKRSVEAELEKVKEVFPVGRPRVFIVLDPWTTKKQILWLLGRGPKEAQRDESVLHEFQRKYFGYSQERKRCFARDLCWYDLNKELRSPVKVAKAWAKKRPDELMELVKKTKDWKVAQKEDKQAAVDDYVALGLPSAVSAAIARLQDAIDYLTR